MSVSVDYNTFINIIGKDDAANFKPDIIKRVLIDAYDQVTEYILENGTVPFDDTLLTEFETRMVREAQIEQAKYMLANQGDFGLIAGFDPLTNTLVSRREIVERIMASRAIGKLHRTRYLWKGLR